MSTASPPPPDSFSITTPVVSTKAAGASGESQDEFAETPAEDSAQVSALASRVAWLKTLWLKSKAHLLIRRFVDFWWRMRGGERILFAGGVCLTTFLVWASLAQVDEITRGSGRVIPSSKVQIIQSSEPSTIEEILVRPGQTVKKGQLLVRLDNTSPQAELGRLETENKLLGQRASRLEGEASGAGCVDDNCGEETRLADIRRNLLQSQLSARSEAVEQRLRELRESQETAKSLESSLALARENVAILAPLAEKAIIPETELLTARRDVVDLEGRLAAATQAIGRGQAAVRQARAEYERARLDFQQNALDEKNRIETRIAVNAETIRDAENRVERSEIRSPAHGVVNDMAINTIGGFVRPGEKIMQIVPLDDNLLIEARISPKDIAFIKEGDPALVKVSAYDFSIYGGLKGRVVRISADSIYDEVERQAYFTVVVETDSAFLMAGDKRLPITPGMICDVEILTGKKSILAYLMKPVAKIQGSALTER